MFPLIGGDGWGIGDWGLSDGAKGWRRDEEMMSWEWDCDDLDGMPIGGDGGCMRQLTKTTRNKVADYWITGDRDRYHREDRGGH